MQVEQFYATMGQSGPSAETYSFVVSRRAIPNASAENWIRAVIKHLNERLHPQMDVELLSYPTFASQLQANEWADLMESKMRDAAIKRIRKPKS